MTETEEEEAVVAIMAEATAEGRASEVVTAVVAPVVALARAKDLKETSLPTAMTITDCMRHRRVASSRNGKKDRNQISMTRRASLNCEQTEMSENFV